ncbi:MAG: hypothetical protein JST86_16085 [Bacteroidetes bacterium]|nr:hypothetical protein [Bacteroidota bacterium]
MGILDFILYPFYLAFFYFVFKFIRSKYNDPILQYYHAQGFWVKALVVLAFAVFNAKLSLGDSFVLYQREGKNLYELILHNSSNIKWLLMPGSDFDESLLADPWNKGYLLGESNFMVVRFVTIFSFFTLGKYVITNLVFSLLAFTGAWKLFLFFYEQYPHLHRKLAIAILYLPTFVFWSSGVLKDSICIASIGWITYSLYQLLVRKRDFLKSTILLLIFGYFLWIIKPYILISYVPFFFLYIILKNVNMVNSKLVKIVLAPLLIIGSMLAFTKIMSNLKEEMGQYAADSITKNMKSLNAAYENQANENSAAFSYGVELDGSIGQMAKMSPIFIGTTFFRPFLWESKKISTLLSSLEGLTLMIFTVIVLFNAGFKTVFQTLTKNPLALYCFLFALIFALFVGATTLNFGTLCRYKIPCMPFYVIALFLIQDTALQKKENLLKNKQAVV